MPTTVNSKRELSAFAVYNQQKAEKQKEYQIVANAVITNKDIEIIEHDSSSIAPLLKKQRKKRINRKKQVDDLSESSSVVSNSSGALKNEKEKKSANGEMAGNKRKLTGAVDEVEPVATRKVQKSGKKVVADSSSEIVEESVAAASSAKVAKIKKKQHKDNVVDVVLKSRSRNDRDDHNSIASASVSSKSTLKSSDLASSQKAKVFNEILPKENHCNMLKPGLVNPCQSFKDFIQLVNFDNSLEASKKVFTWLMHPVGKDQFQQQIWERQPYYINRSKNFNSFYNGLFSTSEFQEIIDKNELQYDVNIDITRYVDNQRETLNPSGRVYRRVVWDFYTSGCSIRMLNPQSYSDSVWRLTSTLQEYFGTFVGANLYLTPPGTQGFAPHFDDIEAFVLQLEGKKRWFVYEPKQVLPRYSSKNFTPDELGKLILAVDLNPGDLLYMPRGFIHQAYCLPDHHSLHITVSSTQLNSFADLFEKMIPEALKISAESDLEFRRSLPLDYMQYTGIVHNDPSKKSPARLHFNAQIKTLWKRLADFLPIDGACDEMSKKFIHDSQPPALAEDEINRSVLAKVDQTVSAEASATTGNLKPIGLKTEVRLIRSCCVRLTLEADNESAIYYNVDNSRVYHGKDIQKLDVTAEEASCIDYLIKEYPAYCKVTSLPNTLPVEDKVELCRALYDRCLLTVKEHRKSSKSESE